MNAPRLQESPRRSKGSSVQSRDFFKLAASIANPSIKIVPKNGADNHFFDAEYIHSPFLDPAYQQCMYSFLGLPLTAPQKEKKLLLSPGPVDVVLFHQTLVSYLTAIPCHSFRLLDQRKQQTSFLVQKAHLLCANRLKNKSWQTNAGVLADIRYFHGNFWSTKKNMRHEILYWLRFDENSVAIEGSLITKHEQ